LSFSAKCGYCFKLDIIVVGLFQSFGAAAEKAFTNIEISFRNKIFLGNGWPSILEISDKYRRFTK